MAPERKWRQKVLNHLKDNSSGIYKQRVLEYLETMRTIYMHIFTLLCLYILYISQNYISQNFQVQVSLKLRTLAAGNQAPLPKATSTTVRAWTQLVVPTRRKMMIMSWRSQKRVSLTPQDQNHWIPSTGSSISSAGAFYCAATTFPASQSISLTSF